MRGDSGPDMISFCDGRLFAIVQNFDGDFPIFIGLVQQRQARLGEPSWKIEQGYATGVQPVKAALPDGTMVFTAVAEDTDDNYNDGACAGAAVGIARIAARPMR